MRKGKPELTHVVVDILIIVSFFFFLSLAEWVSAKIIRAGIIGQIAVGIIYGEPLANILKGPWQETFLAVGYIGLILIIFEGVQKLPVLRLANFNLVSSCVLTGKTRWSSNTT